MYSSNIAMIFLRSNYLALQNLRSCTSLSQGFSVTLLSASHFLNWFRTSVCSSDMSPTYLSHYKYTYLPERHVIIILLLASPHLIR